MFGIIGVHNYVFNVEIMNNIIFCTLTKHVQAKHSNDYKQRDYISDIQRPKTQQIVIVYQESALETKKMQHTQGKVDWERVLLLFSNIIFCTLTKHVQAKHSNDYKQRDYISDIQRPKTQQIVIVYQESALETKKMQHMQGKVDWERVHLKSKKI